MRAISPFARYSIVLSNPAVKRGVDRTGAVVEYSDGEPIIAQFEVSGLTKWEEVEALTHFGDTLGGLPEGVNPLTRISVYDTDLHAMQLAGTEGDLDKVRENLDAQLLLKAKQFPSHFRVVALPAADKPWPTYDELTELDDILALMTATGTDTATVRRYEQENLKRPEVLDALDALDAEVEGGVAEESIRVAL